MNSKGGRDRAQVESAMRWTAPFRKWLVFRGNFVGVVDDEEVDGDFFGLEFEAELLLESGEIGRAHV